MRECKECNVCCKLAEVSEGEFYKPAGILCQHASCKGCDIFDKPQPPKMCNTYQCSWLRGFGGNEDRPDKSGVMISVSAFNGGTWIFVQETQQDAFKTTGKNMVVDIANKLNTPIIVSDYNTELGNDYGDYVIIKKNLEQRSKHIKGNFMFDLDKDLKVYVLKING